MKRALTLLFCLLPSIVTAQEGVVIPSPTAPEAFQAPPAAPPPSNAGGRRRPSMVGYINDADVATQLRIRFDAGFNIKAPDRAEFFYAKSGNFRALPVTNPNYDPNAPGPGPGVVTRLNFSQLYAHAEYAPGPRVSVFGMLPVRFLRPETFSTSTSFGNETGLSDIQFGAKGGLVSNDHRQVTASVQFSAPSGDSLKGLGTDHWSVEPALLYHERASIVSIEAQLGEIFPTDGSAGLPTSSPDKFAGKILYWGVGPSVEIFRRGDTAIAPVVEFVGWHFVDGFQTATSVKGLDVVNVKIGGRVLFAGRSSLYAGWGHALTQKWWYENIVRLDTGSSSESREVPGSCLTALLASQFGVWATVRRVARGRRSAD